MKKTYILGISAFYHDSAAALLCDGVIVAAAQEERFTRKKHDEGFPSNAIKYVMQEAGCVPEDIEHVAFYDKPYIKFERLLETYLRFVPKGLKSFIMAIPVWIKEKLFLKKLILSECSDLGIHKPLLYFPEHHVSHAASAYYPSPFQDAAVLTIDGVGEWATTTICHGQAEQLKICKEIHFPHSLGLLYSAFTYYCGFKVNSGEYKLMGLAPYGQKDSPQTQEFIQKIKETLIDLRDDGSFLLNMPYFNYATGLTMCHNKKWEALFGIPKREAETTLNQDYMNLAYAIQAVTEEAVLKLAKHAKEITGSDNLVMAGGVALNCVANGKLLNEKIFDKIWIQPAAGDAGGALGAALAVSHIVHEVKKPIVATDLMKGAYLGPEFTGDEAKKELKKFGAVYKELNNEEDRNKELARLLNDGNVLGWFQGRMEFGPRALGGRSIIADPRKEDMQKKLNLKIKFREGFRPFAPAVLEEKANDYFNLNGADSPYMLIVTNVNEERQNRYPEGYQDKDMMDRLYFNRSDIPSITHVDYSARVQTVSNQTNPQFWNLLNEFDRQTGCGVLINTSFNVRGEPIVCTPEDAYRCFMRTHMDVLVIDNLIFIKEEQPEWQQVDNWQEEFVLD